MTGKTESPNKSKKGKRLSVERIYQKKTQREHILLRPDSYIGSTENAIKNMWIWNEDLRVIVLKEISYNPGLYKIFDEILGELIFLSQFEDLLCSKDCFLIALLVVG